MGIYIIIFGVLLLFAFFEYYIQMKWMVFVSATTLAIFAGLRGATVGTDTIRYFTSFINVKFGQNDRNFERGYILFERICAKLNFSSTTFFLIFSVISMFLLSLFLFKRAWLPTMSILYYYSRYFAVRDMNQIRESIASIIVLFSIKYIYEKKPLKFLLTIFIAAQFHNVAYIMLLPYLAINLFHFNRNRLGTKYMILTLACAGMSFVISPVIKIIVGESSAYVSYEGFTQSLGLINPVLILEVTLSILLILLVKYRGENMNDFELTSIFVYLLGSDILVLLSQFASLAGRTSGAITTIEMLMVVYLVRAYVPKKFNFLALSVICCIIFFLINVLGNPLVNYLPYVTSK